MFFVPTGLQNPYLHYIFAAIADLKPTAVMSEDRYGKDYSMSIYIGVLALISLFLILKVSNII
jgi:hypothetical protein